MIIKWVNKYSNEIGYVAKINGIEKHFVNTWNPENAMTYSSKKKCHQSH